MCRLGTRGSSDVRNRVFVVSTVAACELRIPGGREKQNFKRYSGKNSAGYVDDDDSNTGINRSNSQG